MIKSLLTVGTLITSISMLFPVESKSESVWIPIDGSYSPTVNYHIDISSLVRKGHFAFYNMCATGEPSRGVRWRLEDCDQNKTGQQVNCKDGTRYYAGYKGKTISDPPRWTYAGERVLNLVCQ